MALIRRIALAALALAAVLPAQAMAQAASCSAPATVDRPKAEGPSKAEPRRLLPIGSYTLALSWSPQFCSTARGPVHAFQCGGKSARFGFILHGLWPDGVGPTWPQYCRSADILPRAVIRDNLCMTPSAQLLQNEWARHGTCMATKPELYFNLGRAFYASIRYPDMNALSRRPTLTVAQFAEAFAKVNRTIKPHMLRVTTTRGNWLSELWICLDKQMDFARCPANKRGANPASLLRIEPGPVMPRAGPAARPARAAPAPGKPRIEPARRPGLRLDLDPKVQPLPGDGAR
ncbi:MAG: ribonuclease T [Sphingobium sp.]